MIWNNYEQDAEREQESERRKREKEKIRTKHGVKVKNFGQISIEHNSLGHPYKKFQLS